MSRVSVIVPVYNTGRYVEKCIRSIMSQSYRDIEIVVINDGSTDDSGEICERLAAEDERIVYIPQENRGVSAARNVGLERATGEWICFVDGDDWLEPDAVERMAREVAEAGCGSTDAEDSRVETGVELVVGYPDIIITDYFVDTPTRSYEESFFAERTARDFEPSDNDELAANCMVRMGFANMRSITALGVPWARLIRAEFIREHGVSFDIDVVKMQDALFMTELLGVGARVVYRPGATYHYRQTMDSICGRYSPDYMDKADRLLRAYRAYIRRSGKDSLRGVYYARKFSFMMEGIKFIYVLDETGLSLREKVEGTGRLIRGVHFSRRARTEMRPYLRFMYRVAGILGRLHMYGTIYMMVWAYYEYKNLRRR